MKAFFSDNILDLILGFGLSSTTLTIWPGFDLEQDRWSAMEVDQNLIACRKDDDRQS